MYDSILLAIIYTFIGIALSGCFFPVTVTLFIVLMAYSIHLVILFSFSCTEKITHSLAVNGSLLNDKRLIVA